MNLLGIRYALKKPIIDSKDENAKNRFEKELALMAELRHSNLVMLFGCSDTLTPHLVMEFMNKGTLYGHLSGRAERSVFLPWSARYSIAMNIASGLAYLHDIMEIIHLDLKSENVLLCSYQDNPYFAKISDFGTSVFLSDKKKVFHTNKLIGTPAYIAPELIKVLIYDKEYKEYKKSGLYEFTKKTDIFSLAIILWELMT